MGAAASLLPPSPLAGEAGRGVSGCAARQRLRCVERPSPSPSRKREGRKGAAAAGRERKKRAALLGRRKMAQPLQILSSPACGGGRVGASGRATRQGPLHRGTLSRPLPQAGGEKAEGPPLSGRGEGSGPLGGRKMMGRPRRFLPSPACGGGRVGVSGRSARQGPPRRETLPQPLSQAGGEMTGRPPLSGRGKREQLLWVGGRMTGQPPRFPLFSRLRRGRALRSGRACRPCIGRPGVRCPASCGSPGRRGA